MKSMLKAFVFLLICHGVSAIQFTGRNWNNGDGHDLQLYPSHSTGNNNVTWNLVERHELNQAISNANNDRNNMINQLRNNIQNQILEQIKVTDDQIEALMTPKIKKIIKDKLKEEIKAELKKEILAEIQGQ